MFNIISTNIFKPDIINNINFTGNKKAAAANPPKTEIACDKDMFTLSSKSAADEIAGKIKNAQEELEEAETAFKSISAQWQKVSREYHKALEESIHTSGGPDKEENIRKFKELQRFHNSTKKEYNALKKKIKTLKIYISDLEIYKNKMKPTPEPHLCIIPIPNLMIL